MARDQSPPYPLGATFDGAGTNVSIFSEVAEAVELCLFADDGSETRVEIPESDGFVWHAYLPEVVAGQRYGFRVHAPWDPRNGLRSNPAKLLLDPYSKAIDGTVTWGQPVFPYRFDDPDQPDDADSAPLVPRSVVVSPFFDWRDDRRPRIPLNETVVYETHVRGISMHHPEVPEEIRGSYFRIGPPRGDRPPHPARDHRRRVAPGPCLHPCLYPCGNLDFGHQASDALFQVVSDRSDFLDGLARWVFDFPVDIPFAGEDRAGVTASHGDDDVGGSDYLVGPWLGDLPADVDPLFGHGGYGSLVDLVGGFGSTGKHVNMVVGEVTHPPGCHLGASGVVDTEEEDTGVEGGCV